MPTYGYRCQSCKREFDVWQRMSDEPVAACPTCGGGGKRLFFPAGLVFKGSGFYATDNRRSPAGANGSGDGGGKSAAAKKSESETSTTPKSSPKSGESAGAASGSTTE
ncbi:MAG TPA: FmdB family zinc ribbon protein [Candidatus Dormibacteraeota bacterium]